MSRWRPKVEGVGVYPKCLEHTNSVLQQHLNINVSRPDALRVGEDIKSMSFLSKVLLLLCGPIVVGSGITVRNQRKRFCLMEFRKMGLGDTVEGLANPTL